ncbi:MAG: hypothetical protein DRG33_00730 [Deltaproteobacteria bacterium]|nr:MAG: hypothetical protein DRG33_00730 [Deltaproteobacteria bacterium]
MGKKRLMWILGINMWIWICLCFSGNLFNTFAEENDNLELQRLIEQIEAQESRRKDFIADLCVEIKASYLGRPTTKKGSCSYEKGDLPRMELLKEEEKELREGSIREKLNAFAEEFSKREFSEFSRLAFKLAEALKKMNRKDITLENKEESFDIIILRLKPAKIPFQVEIEINFNKGLVEKKRIVDFSGRIIRQEEVSYEEKEGAWYPKEYNSVSFEKGAQVFCKIRLENIKAR